MPYQTKRQLREENKRLSWMLYDAESHLLSAYESVTRDDAAQGITVGALRPNVPDSHEKKWYERFIKAADDAHEAGEKRGREEALTAVVNALGLIEYKGMASVKVEQFWDDLKATLQAREDEKHQEALKAQRERIERAKPAKPAYASGGYVSGSAGVFDSELSRDALNVLRQARVAEQKATPATVAKKKAASEAAKKQSKKGGKK